MVAVVERSSSTIRANVAAWNAYDNEPWRLPDGASEQGDDVEPIETSRPDTRKVEGEEPDNRHRRSSYAPGIGSERPSALLWPSPDEEGSRVLRVHLRKGAPPTCGPPELADRTVSQTLPGHLTREHARYVHDNCLMHHRSLATSKYISIPIIPMKVRMIVMNEMVVVRSDRISETIRVLFSHDTFQKSYTYSSIEFLNLLTIKLTKIINDRCLILIESSIVAMIKICTIITKYV